MKLVIDTHMHTVASGHAYSTWEEMAHAASEKGLKMIAITDHSPKMPGSTHELYFYNLSVIPKEMFGVRILKGVELNILDADGTIDLPTHILRKLDFVIASLHGIIVMNMGVEGNTKALRSALRNPYIDGIAHPGEFYFPIDPVAVCNTALAEQKFLEINNQHSSIDVDCNRELIEVARDMGVHFMTGSDAHFRTDVGEFKYVHEFLDELDISPKQVLNSDVAHMERYLDRRRERITRAIELPGI